MDKPKKLILDYSKWICGAGGAHALGSGAVALLNEDGFMCCLGQWGLQCGAKKEEILNFGEPQEIKPLLPLFAKALKYPVTEYNPVTGIEETNYVEDNEKSNTRLSLDAIDINDNTKTTPEEKIELLRELLANEGIELEVINKP